MENIKTIGLIPCRLESTRIYQKPLIKFNDIPMFVHVYNRSKKVKNIDEVYICTDSKVIKEIAYVYDIPCIMTGQHENGTMRCAEAANILSLNNKDYVIDIQGDEPLLNSSDVEIVVDYIHNNNCEIVIPHFMINRHKDYSVVKIVESNNQILYMSRHSIPYGASTLKKHVDFIGFTQESLQKYAMLSPTYNEQTEKIELMRAIDYGMNVKTVLVNNENISVNTLDDVDKVKRIFKCMK